MSWGKRQPHSPELFHPPSFRLTGHPWVLVYCLSSPGLCMSLEHSSYPVFLANLPHVQGVILKALVAEPSPALQVGTGPCLRVLEMPTLFLYSLSLGLFLMCHLSSLYNVSSMRTGRLEGLCSVRFLCWLNQVLKGFSPGFRLFLTDLIMQGSANISVKG